MHTCISVNGIFMNVCFVYGYYYSHCLVLFMPITSVALDNQQLCITIEQDSINTSNKGITTRHWELNVVWKCNIYSHSF